MGCERSKEVPGTRPSGNSNQDPPHTSRSCRDQGTALRNGLLHAWTCARTTKAISSSLKVTNMTCITPSPSPSPSSATPVANGPIRSPLCHRPWQPLARPRGQSTFDSARGSYAVYYTIWGPLRPHYILSIVHEATSVSCLRVKAEVSPFLFIT
jgi:hypothetical protein